MELLIPMDPCPVTEGNFKGVSAPMGKHSYTICYIQ
jgi:hypothetical protein